MAVGTAVFLEPYAAGRDKGGLGQGEGDSLRERVVTSYPPTEIVAVDNIAASIACFVSSSTSRHDAKYA